MYTSDIDIIWIYVKQKNLCINLMNIKSLDSINLWNMLINIDISFINKINFMILI